MSEGLGRLVRLEAHNEIVLAPADGAVGAMAPDRICMISAVDGVVVDVDKAYPGLEVEVMVVRAAPAWHTLGAAVRGAGPAGSRRAGSAENFICLDRKTLH
ncbi:S-methyl thiohydantoin desulfurase domain-containing protein [Streptosporangium roseum]|uniref:S-methyl thiohydantoin desulfurase domain-containing protein n=1 Tax=Streptosporangium roseum TaxID=2001 RepID=UPI00331E3B4A